VVKDGCEREDSDLSEEEWCSLEQELLSLEEEDDEPYDELTALHFHRPHLPTTSRS
jgi:hypothetical protein